MGPLPYPHRATFLASTLTVSAEQNALAPFIARLLSVIVFDHLLRHPVVTLADHDDERLTDDSGRLLDTRHPQVEDSIEWLFRVSRRHEVLWFELSFDRARPAAAVLRAQLPDGTVDEWRTRSELTLSQQLGQCLAQWLASRRLPAVEPLPPFTLDDVRGVAERLRRADEQLRASRELAALPGVSQPPPRLAVPYLRVLGELARDETRSLDAAILAIDPAHLVARRNRYVAGLLTASVDPTSRAPLDRRDILPVIGEAPMYAKPHLSVWGSAFTDRPLESMGVRHQGIAASLMPANPYACHNYSLQLAEDGRREESYRWADRATVAAPQFGAAHLDCVRRLRQVGRPGQSFAEAQYRCREILDRAAAGKLSTNDWQAPHHAALLIAFVHLDIGRLTEAIEIADQVMAQVPDEPGARDGFAWVDKRLVSWKHDPALLSRAYGWEAYHRGEVGRALVGLTRSRLTDDDDAMMLIDALCMIGRPDEATCAFWQCAGQGGGGILGDGKARLAAAKALILTGDLEEALDQIQIVQLRRGQSRLEAEINRLFRLAACRQASEWEAEIERRLERGAVSLARMAARDLADFVPGLDTPVIRRALGERKPLAIDPVWIAELIAAVPAAQSASSTIIARLAPPPAATLAAADTLAQEWWTVLVPAARDRDAHAASAMLALGLALANYLVAASGPPTPIAGAYRHIATEALHLVRRARYQIEPAAIQALLRIADWLGDAPEWLLDTWLLRIERALDLEAEHGSYLAAMVADMPTVQRLLRGDERIGWELRLAHDLARDPSQYEPAAALFARSARALEAGGVWRAWSTAAASAGAEAQLDVQWSAALANPSGVAAPWLRLAQALLAGSRRTDGFAAACRAIAATPPKARSRAVAELAPLWSSAGIGIPLDGALAYELGVAAVADDQLDIAVPHLRWAAALDPANPKRTHSLAVALAQLERAHEAIHALARHDRSDPARTVGRVLFDAGHYATAVPILRYAAHRFTAVEDWGLLARAAHRADDDAVTAAAGRRAIALGASEPAVLAAVATSLYRLGEFAACEQLAQRLISDGGDRASKLIGLHAMARSLAGQGRHVDAHRYAKAASELGPNGALADELADTLERIIAQESPSVRPSSEQSLERQACDALEAGKLELLLHAAASPSWGIARVALAACEVRRDDESGVPVSPRALEAAVDILERSEGVTQTEAVLTRIRALRIRDNAFIQIDPPPPLGLRFTPEEFERLYAERVARADANAADTAPSAAAQTDEPASPASAAR